MKRYEYTTKICKVDKLQDILNKYGEYGYEMTEVIKDGDEYQIIFKREI